MLKVTIVLLLSVIFICPSVYSQTAESNNEITINIVAPELKPLIYNNVDRKAEGLLVDTLNQVSKNSPLNLNVTVLPWGRAMLEVKSGNSDAIMPALYTEERAKSLVFPKQQLVNFNGSVLIKRISDEYQFTSFDEIKTTKSIAKVRAVMMGEPFETAKKKSNVKIVEVSKLTDALNMLLLERVDLVVADAYAAYSEIVNLNIKDKTAIMLISKVTEPSYLAFSSEFSLLHDVNEIMSIINQYNNPDSYQDILSDK